MALESPHFHRLYMTHVHGSYTADAFFPPVDLSAMQEVNDPDTPQGLIRDSGYEYEVRVYEKQ